MAISKIVIKNFRSIENCELELQNLNALVGENNAGKSNILRALKCVLGSAWINSDTFCEEDHFDHDTSREIEISLHLSPAIYYQKFKKSPKVEIGILKFAVKPRLRNSKRGEKGELRVEQSCLKSDGSPVFIPPNAGDVTPSAKWVPLTGNIPQEVRDQLPLIYVGIDRRLETQLPSVNSSLLRKMFSDVDEAIHETIFDKNTDPVKTHLDVFRERLSVALEALRVEEFIKLEQDLRDLTLKNLGVDSTDTSQTLDFHFGLFDSIDFLKSIQLRFKENDRVMDALDLGDGAKNALVVAIFQAYEARQKEGALILIEEPEMFLHPHRRRLFYTTLKKISENNQVIYTTHSPEFIDVADYQNLHIVYRENGGSTHVRKSNLLRNTNEIEKLRREVDTQRSEIFFAKHVLLAEGPTEEMALPEYAKRLAINLDQAGCTIVGVGGKQGLIPFAEILSSFGIPFSVMFDTDDEANPVNKNLNTKLRDLKLNKIRIFEMSLDFEDVVRRTNGKENYEQLEQKYPFSSKNQKPTMQRFIAADTATQIAKEISEVINSLVAKKSDVIK